MPSWRIRDSTILTIHLHAVNSPTSTVIVYSAFMMGSFLANKTSGYAPEKIQYGIDRYKNETRRLYRVMDQHLQKSSSGYLVGDRCTIADISCWGWVAAAGEFHLICDLLSAVEAHVLSLEMCSISGLCG